MIHLITGGSGSGKSAYAEQRAMSLGTVRYYIATMEPFGEEGERRIKKHRAMRDGKGFQTVECCHHLTKLRLGRTGMSWIGTSQTGTSQPDESQPDAGQTVAKQSVALLECMTNLVANEQFSVGGSDEEILARIRDGVRHLTGQVSHLVIVTGEVFSDGVQYDGETTRYLSLLGQINRDLAEMADQVTEVVYGIPVKIPVCPHFSVPPPDAAFP